LKKGDGRDCDDLPGWGIKKDHVNLTRNSQTTGWHWNRRLAVYDV